MKEPKDIYKTDLNIYEYYSYRKFLDDFFSEVKKNDKKFSIAAFSRKIKISPNLIGLFIRGERNISFHIAESICDEIGFSNRKTRYFLYLVEYNQASDQNSAELVFREIVKIQKSAGEYELSKMQFEYYDKWYYPVVKELLCWYDWNNDYSILAKAVTPAITQAEAKKAVTLLEEIGLVAYNDGKYIETKKVILGDTVPIHKKKLIRDSIMDLSKDAVNSFDRDERYTSFHTLSLTNDLYEDVTKIIRDAEEKIQELINKDHQESDRVYQVVFNAFPVSEKNSPGEEK